MPPAAVILQRLHQGTRLAISPRILSLGLAVIHCLSACDTGATDNRWRTALADDSMRGPIVIPAGTHRLTPPLLLDRANLSLSGPEAQSNHPLVANVRLGGDDGALDEAVLHFTEPCPAEGCLQLQADGLKLQRMTITGTGGGPLLAVDASQSLQLHRLRLRHTVPGNSAMLKVEHSANLLLDNLDLRGHVQRGEHPVAALRISHSRRVILSNSLVTEAAIGVELLDCNAIDLRDNRLLHNAVGVSLSGAAPDGSTRVLIEGNAFEANNQLPGSIAQDPAGIGLWLRRAADIELSGNRFHLHGTAHVRLDQIATLRGSSNQWTPTSGLAPADGVPTTQSTAVRWDHANHTMLAKCLDMAASAGDKSSPGARASAADRALATDLRAVKAGRKSASEAPRLSANAAFEREAPIVACLDEALIPLALVF